MTNRTDRPTFPDAQTINLVLEHPRYRDTCEKLSTFLVRSRSDAQSPKALLDLQGDMAEALLGLQRSQHRSRRAADDLTKTEESRWKAFLSLSTDRRLAYLIRQVADGIAWRLFRHDRVVLYQVALKPQTGHLEETTINDEFQAAERHAAQGTPVLLNDLTNFVRFGDLTLMLDGSVKIVEVKRAKGSGKSGRSTRQGKRLAGLADFINTGSRLTEHRSERLVRLDTEPKTHLPEVQQLIRTAKNRGSAHARLSDSLAVDVFFVEAAKASNTRQRSLIEIRHNPFSESKKAIIGDNLDFFWHFSPIKAPYSVFPWSDEDCADVLSGRIWVITYFNWDKVERTLKRRGLLVNELRPEHLKHFLRLPIQVQRQRNFDLGLAVSRSGGASCTVSLADFGRLLYEFLDEQVFAEAIEEVLDMGIEPGERYFTAFENEDSIWN